MAFGISDDAQQFYAFVVDNQSRYRLERWTGSSWVVLKHWTAAPPLNTEQAVNHVMLVRQGAQIILYANGQYLTTVTDTMLGAGRLGVYVRSLADPNVDARYDNYRAYRVGSGVLNDGSDLPASEAGVGGFGNDQDLGDWKSQLSLQSLPSQAENQAPEGNPSIGSVRRKCASIRSAASSPARWASSQRSRQTSITENWRPGMS